MILTRFSSLESQQKQEYRPQIVIRAMKSSKNKNKCVSVSFVATPAARIVPRKPGYSMTTRRINQ
jgi:hypothetical protein